MNDKPKINTDSTACEGGPMSNREPAEVRGRWLAKLSVTLAVLIEVFPIEADLSYGHILGYPTRISDILTIKLVCVWIILLPLLIYIMLNGYRALRRVRGRVLAVVAIISLRFIVDWCAIISILHGAKI
jgi:hypothetical protein